MNALDLGPSPVAQPEAPEADVDLLRRLAGCLAHHVNNSLTGVIGYLELGLRGLSPRSTVGEHLQASLDCAYQAAAAVKRIVAFAARPEAPPARHTLALAHLTEQAVERLRARNHPGLNVQAHLTAAGLVLASESVLLAALDHVLSNALESMPTGGNLVLRVTECDGWCQLSIADSGGGIPDEMLPFLFKPFHTSKTSGHLGLGLVQCRDLLQLLGGRLEISSATGQGATAILALPCHDACRNLRAVKPW